MKLYRFTAFNVLAKEGTCFRLDETWDNLINRPHLYAYLQEVKESVIPPPDWSTALAPLGQQEVWAAGVTYLRSKVARMEESPQGQDFYDLVHSAERPELFFKANAYRVKGPGQAIRIRRDSTWNVPEPEFTLCINTHGEIVGYTIGNDVSSRSIEGENPLYLPQAKVYDGAASMGPCLWITNVPPSLETAITLTIYRHDQIIFTGQTQLKMMKRKFGELVEFLYREMSFPFGCYLMTGTGVVPGGDFTLQSADRVDIRVEPIGILSNIVA